MRNSSVTDLDNEDGGHISVDSILRTMAYCVIFILGLVGNVFVLYALKQKKRRRTANDWFILNLTISDILLIMCIPADVYLEVGNFPYNILFCKVQRPLSTLVYFVSIFTITAMALERHQVITKPFQPKMEQQRAFLVVGGIWVLALVFIVPLPIVTSAGAGQRMRETLVQHLQKTVRSYSRSFSIFAAFSNHHCSVYLYCYLSLERGSLTTGA